jgi:serine/threonine protein kinase
MKHFNDVSCVFCGQRTAKDVPTCNACGEPIDIQNDLAGQIANQYELAQYKARGFYGLTFRAVHILSGKVVAIKLISKVAYSKNSKDFDSEIRLHASIPDSPNIVRFLDAGQCELTSRKQSLSFFYIISEWIQGTTFLDFLKAPVLGAEDLLIAARDMLVGLAVLNVKQLWHNDLHDENILIRDLSSQEMRVYGRSIPRMFIIVDIGSAVYRNPKDVKQLGDMTNVGSHLSTLVSTLMSRFDRLTKEDQAFIEMVQEALARLTDETPGRGFRDPTEALDRIETLYQQSRVGEQIEQRELDDPYSYVNANDIPSNLLLVKMFSQRFRYFKEISSPGHQSLLITGPRGSGKTMVLKNMRFVTQFDSFDAEKSGLVKAMTFIGLYFSARTNFGNYLVSYRDQAWVKSEKHVAMYFNILITIELASVLYRLKSATLLPRSAEEAILDLITRAFSFPITTLHTLKERLTSLSKQIINDATVPITVENSTPSYLVDLFYLFKHVVPSISDKPVILLVDDLSLSRIPTDLQKALVPAIFNTGASYKTRITAHSDGLILQDPGQDTYKENRDFSHINLGYQYWQMSDVYAECRDGFNDVLEKRFALAKRAPFLGIEKILGLGTELEKIGFEIRRLAAAKKLRTLKYHGSKILVKLCSGDLSYLLDMLGKMERDSTQQKYPVSTSVQNRIIKHYARNELRSLQDIRPTNSAVPSLYDIAYYFGVWSLCAEQEGFLEESG